MSEININGRKIKGRNISTGYPRFHIHETGEAWEMTTDFSKTKGSPLFKMYENKTGKTWYIREKFVPENAATLTIDAFAYAYGGGGRRKARQNVWINIASIQFFNGDNVKIIPNEKSCHFWTEAPSGVPKFEALYNDINRVLDSNLNSQIGGYAYSESDESTNIKLLGKVSIKEASQIVSKVVIHLGVNGGDAAWSSTKAGHGVRTYVTNQIDVVLNGSRIFSAYEHDNDRGGDSEGTGRKVITSVWDGARWNTTVGGW